MDVDAPTASSSTSPLTYIEQQETSSPDSLKPLFTRIRTAYEKKLWHNLTVALTEFVFHPESGPYQVDLFQKFVTTVEKNLNALRLVEIARRVGAQFTEAQQTLDFLQSLHSRLEKPYATLPSEEDPIGKPAPSRPAPEAYALSLSSIAYAQLLLGDLKACKSSLDECEKLLGEIDSVDMVVNAGYYLVAAEYFKVKADYAPYYKNALLYLACIDEKKELSEQDMRQRAHDLCIAALLGETIYNFGELLLHPILQTLTGSEWEWIKSLISAFNAGDIGKFDSLANNFEAEPILNASINFLRQKICLMALIQAAFSRPRNGASRLMTFESIAAATKLPVNEVEHLCMKAMSLDLIRGSLDQVDSTLDVKWVQPRVLDHDQLATLSKQFNEWSGSVGQTAEAVHAHRVDSDQKPAEVRAM